MKYKVKSIAAIILAAVLAASGIAVGVVAAVKNGNTIKNDDFGGGMQIGSSSGKGVSLMSARIAPEDFDEYGVSPMAETAQTLTATVMPSDAANKEVNWSIAWKNAESSWATGKTVTDYVTVTPTADGALTATVACLQAFGEQIIVTATSRDVPDAFGTATVDYEKKVIDITATMKKNGSPVSVVDWTYSGESYSWEYAAVYSEYTIDATYTLTHLLKVGGISDEIRDQPLLASSCGSSWSTGSIVSDQSNLTYTTSQQGAYNLLSFTGSGKLLNTYKNIFSASESSAFELLVYVKKVGDESSTGTPYKTFEYFNGTCNFTTKAESVTIDQNIVF